MHKEGLQSQAFQKDMADVIYKINQKYRLNIQCGIVTLGDESLMIQLDTKPLDE